jgi:hypothetical protein
LKINNTQTEKLDYIENVYLIPRSSHSYEFFHSEFKTLPLDSQGNILLNYGERKEKKNIVKDILLTIKDHLVSNDKSVGIPIGSAEYSFFNTEYHNQLVKDANQNIIVPEEEYPKTKVKTKK